MKKPNIFYKIFSSTKTAIILFIIYLFFYLVGSVLPYKGDYNNITATGTILNIIKGLDLLHVYSGPWFLVLSAVFFANLIVCTYHRLKGILKERIPARLSLDYFSNQSNITKLTLKGSFDDISKKAESFFCKRLYRRKSSTIAGENFRGNVFVNGILNHTWISLIYHFALVLVLIGCTITFLFAFEGEVTVFPEKSSEVPLVSKDTHWYKCVNSIRGWFGRAGKDFVVQDDKKLVLSLQDFGIKYTHRPKVKDYPRSGFIPRMNRIWNIQQSATTEVHEDKVFSPWLLKLIGNVAKTLTGTKEAGALSVFSTNDSFFPTEYTSRLLLQEPPSGSPQREINIEVNSPFRYRGTTLYQSAYDYKFDIYANDKKVNIGEDGKFKVEDADGTFEKGDVIRGTFYRKDGIVSQIKPFVRLYYLSGNTDDKKPSKEDLGRFEENLGKEVKGIKIVVKNITAGTVLSYRYDPGLKLLWIERPPYFSLVCFTGHGGDGTRYIIF